MARYKYRIIERWTYEGAIKRHVFVVQKKCTKGFWSWWNMMVGKEWQDERFFKKKRDAVIWSSNLIQY